MPFSDSRIFHGIASNLIGIILGLALMLAGCTNPAAQSTGQTQTANDNVEEVVVSWVFAYTLEDLVWGADLIVEGSIAGIQETRLESELIFTDYRLDVSRVLKGYPGFADRSVEVISKMV